MLMVFFAAVWRGAPGRPLIAWPINALFLQGLLPIKACGQPDGAWSGGFVHFNSNGVGWFLADIVWLICAFPLLFNIFRKAGLPLTGIVLVILVVLRMLPELLSPEWSRWDMYGQGFSGSFHLYAFAPLRLLEYVAGMLTSRFIALAPPKLRSMALSGWGFDLVLLLTTIAVYCSLGYIHESTIYTGECFLLPLWCFLCAMACFSAGSTGGPLHWALSWGPLPNLAPYSFLVYIFQTAILNIPRIQLGAGLAFPWNVVSIWGVSALLYIYVEEPMTHAASALLLNH
jgi:hypothetical protein